ncbi:hypothetical protein [Tolypothrix sp. FACHB-123]|nr:hypothetical protein [Tolypothrix sp. FACHB-123]
MINYHWSFFYIPYFITIDYLSINHDKKAEWLKKRSQFLTLN